MRRTDLWRVAVCRQSDSLAGGRDFSDVFEELLVQLRMMVLLEILKFCDDLRLLPLIAVLFSICCVLPSLQIAIYLEVAREDVWDYDEGNCCYNLKGVHHTECGNTEEDREDRVCRLKEWYNK